MVHKRCEVKHMSGAAAVRNEMQQRVREVAALAEGNRKAALAFAARVLNMDFDRVRRIFYGQARRIEAHEADQIRAYVTAAQKLIQARAEYEALRKEFVTNAHPALVRVSPSKLAEDEVSQAAQEAVVADKARRPLA